LEKSKKGDGDDDAVATQTNQKLINKLLFQLIYFVLIKIPIKLK